MPDSLPELEVERRKILLQFTCLGDLRTGSICAVTRRCGKPTCQCARPDDPGHDPQVRLKSCGVPVGYFAGRRASGAYLFSGGGRQVRFALPAALAFGEGLGAVFFDGVSFVVFHSVTIHCSYRGTIASRCLVTGSRWPGGACRQGQGRKAHTGRTCAKVRTPSAAAAAY